MARILIVDDEPTVRRVVARICAREGYETATAENGELAIELLRNEHFDAVLCDICMPGVSGLQVLERVKHLQIETPFVIITGYNMLDVAPPKKLMTLGAYDFIQKPFSFQELVPIVGCAVASRGASDENRARHLKTLLSADTRKELEEFLETGCDDTGPASDAMDACKAEPAGKHRSLDPEAKLYPFVIGGLIHDVFGVLGALRGNLEALDEAVGGEGNSEEIARSFRGAERLERVMRLVQSISRPYYKPDAPDLVKPVEAIVDSIKIHRTANPNVEYTHDIDPAVVDGGALPLGVTTFFVGELLSNASRACEGCGKATVTLSIRCSGKETVIECVDSGGGFSDEQLSVVNEGRARPPAQPGRGGYGLYLMTQIALRLGGEVRASRTEPSGARVRITLRPEEALDEQD